MAEQTNTLEVTELNITGEARKRLIAVFANGSVWMYKALRKSRVITASALLLAGFAVQESASGEELYQLYCGPVACAEIYTGEGVLHPQVIAELFRSGGGLGQLRIIFVYDFPWYEAPSFSLYLNSHLAERIGGPYGVELSPQDSLTLFQNADVFIAGVEKAFNSPESFMLGAWPSPPSLDDIVDVVLEQIPNDILQWDNEHGNGPGSSPGDPPAPVAGATNLTPPTICESNPHLCGIFPGGTPGDLPTPPDGPTNITPATICESNPHLCGIFPGGIPSDPPKDSPSYQPKDPTEPAGYTDIALARGPICDSLDCLSPRARRRITRTSRMVARDLAAATPRVTIDLPQQPSISIGMSTRSITIGTAPTDSNAEPTATPSITIGIQPSQNSESEGLMCSKEQLQAEASEVLCISRCDSCAAYQEARITAGAASICGAAAAAIGLALSLETGGGSLALVAKFGAAGAGGCGVAWAGMNASSIIAKRAQCISYCGYIWSSAGGTGGAAP